MSEILLGGADAPATSGYESLLFDPDSNPVEVNDSLNYTVEDFEYTPARPKTEWAESADADGALPTAPDYYTNAEGDVTDSRQAAGGHGPARAEKRLRTPHPGRPAFRWSPRLGADSLTPERTLVRG